MVIHCGWCFYFWLLGVAFDLCVWHFYFVVGCLFCVNAVCGLYLV